MPLLINVLIVEDELYSRAKLSHFLSLTDKVREVREAEHGLSGVNTLKSWHPDLLIVDIQMPYLNGFEVIQQLPREQRPVIIFTTAHETYALKAFEVNALDYLLKPFSLERFRRSFQRAYDQIKLVKGPLNLTPTITPMSASHQDEGSDSTASETEYLSHIRVEGPKKSQMILAIDQVMIVRALGNYAEFVTQHTSYLRRGALKGVVARLDPREFMQINRSEVVRIEYIKEVIPGAHGDAELVTHANSSLRWTRRYRSEAGGRFEV